MKELRELISAPGDLCPLNHNKQFISLTCSCKFEPWGKASAAWEEVWELNVEVPNNGTGLHLRGKSYDDVMLRAKAILKSGYGKIETED